MGPRFTSDALIMTIHLKNVTLSYEHHPAVHHLNTTINQGEWLAVVGPNGAGKSTLLNAMAGLSTVNEGCIEGLDPKRVAYLPQQTQLDKSFPINVFELVSIGLWPQMGFAKALTPKHRELCEKAIAAVGLEGFEHRLIGTLSGGQLQRSLFARVLLQDQPTILLDEPFNAIDAKTLRDLTQVIKQWHKDERTIVMVTHDLNYVREHCPHTLLLARECIAKGASQTVLTHDNLKKATQLSEAFDERASWCFEGAA